MKRRIGILAVGLLMLVVAICFIVYALNNPQASFPWGNGITYTLYAVYGIVMLLCIIFGAKKKK